MAFLDHEASQDGDRAARMRRANPKFVLRNHLAQAAIERAEQGDFAEVSSVVTAWEGPVYSIEAEAPGLGWTLRVEVHRALAFEGHLVVDDPDGIVVDARFVDPGACAGHLIEGHPWVREPLVEWLGERWAGTRGFGYRVEGDDLATLTVRRL